MTDPMPMNELTRHLESIGFAETLAAGRKRLKELMGRVYIGDPENEE